jgi:protein-S-isoprenylcysteine O-methyltransferase Ste14
MISPIKVEAIRREAWEVLSLLFMKIFTGIALACATFEVFYAVSHRKGGTGPIPDRAKSLTFAIISLVFISLVIAHAVLLFIDTYPDLSFVFSTPFDLWLQIVGTILIFLSGVLGLWGPLSLGEFIADFRLVKGHRVVNTGAYRWVRHPMYAALIFWCAGSLLFFKSLLFVFLLALIPAAYVKARGEEKMLIEAFGREYERYRDATGMFSPQFFKERR